VTLVAYLDAAMPLHPGAHLPACCKDLKNLCSSHMVKAVQEAHAASILMVLARNSGWAAEARACIHGLRTQLLLDPQELVVLGQALAPAWCTCFDLPGAQADDQVCNE